MLDFLDYLKNFENEDVSKTEALVKEKWDKTISVIKEAFGEKYTNKDYAIHKIQNEFVKKTPASIDASFLNENMNYIVKKIESLTEGEIKIIIHNNEASPGSSCGSCSTAQASMDNVPVVVTGGGIDMEMESAKPRGRGRPPKAKETVEPSPAKEESVQPQEDAIKETDNIINSIEGVQESAEVLEEKKKAKAKKEAEECKEDKNKKEEDKSMKKENTITWRDIEGIAIESIKEDILPKVKAKDTVVVDGKKYQVEEVIPNTKNPDLTKIRVSSQEIFVLGEIDSHEALNEEEEITPAVGEELTKSMEVEPEAGAEGAEGGEAGEEAGEGDHDEAKEKEVTEEDIEKLENGDKIVIDGEKYLVLEYDPEEKEITVEDEDGEEQVFKCDEIEVEEIEKVNDEEEENEDEEKEEGAEKVEESYDPEGDKIHSDIWSARKILEMNNTSEGMPKIPATVKAGSTLSKHTMPQAQGMPKTDVKLPAGATALSHTMPQAEGMPKTTGVESSEIQKKEKTADGYTHTAMKHTMPQAQGMPKADTKLPSSSSLSNVNMPQADGMPKTDVKLPSGSSLSKHNMPQAEGMPKMPKTVKESYLANANRFLAD